MKSVVRIGNRPVGPGHPVYVVAEAGVNHNGDVEVGRELVRRAAACGADAVKFQTFRADAVATRNAPKAAYQVETTGTTQSQLEMLRALELSDDDHRTLIAECHACGIEFLSTPYGNDDLRLLCDLGVGAVKIASGQIVEPELIEAAARYGRPALLSTGMATMAEVQAAVDMFAAAGGQEIVVLQCTTNYPSPAEDANLLAMGAMRTKLGVPVGYSDHTQGIVVPVAAVALGAVLIEKHFTLDRDLPGPDHSSSAEPGELAAMVRGIRDVERALGAGDKAPLPRELRNRAGMRRSVVARIDLTAGTLLDRGMLAIKRPGTGIAPADMNRVIGRTLAVPVAADTLLEWGHFR